MPLVLSASEKALLDAIDPPLETALAEGTTYSGSPVIGPMSGYTHPQAAPFKAQIKAAFRALAMAMVRGGVSGGSSSLAPSVMYWTGGGQINTFRIYHFQGRYPIYYGAVGGGGESEDVGVGDDVPLMHNFGSGSVVAMWQVSMTTNYRYDITPRVRHNGVWSTQPVTIFNSTDSVKTGTVNLAAGDELAITMVLNNGGAGPATVSNFSCFIK